MKSAMYDFPPSSTEPGAGVSSNYYDKSFHANNGLVVNENRPYCRGIFDFTCVIGQWDDKDIKILEVSSKTN